MIARGAGGTRVLSLIVVLVAVFGVAILVPQPARSQEPDPTQEDPPPGRFGIYAGWGNFYGGLGAMAELPVGGGRIRPYAGLGYRGWLSWDGHHGVTGAVGVTFPAPAPTGRGFWGISVTEIGPSQRWFGGTVETSPDGLPRRSWGPVIHGGWRTGKGSGWNVRVETGFGLGLPDGFVAFLAGIGVGYSWP